MAAASAEGTLQQLLVSRDPFCDFELEAILGAIDAVSPSSPVLRNLALAWQAHPCPSATTPHVEALRHALHQRARQQFAPLSDDRAAGRMEIQASLYANEQGELIAEGEANAATRRQLAVWAQKRRPESVSPAAFEDGPIMAFPTSLLETLATNIGLPANTTAKHLRRTAQAAIASIDQRLAARAFPAGGGSRPRKRTADANQRAYTPGQLPKRRAGNSSTFREILGAAVPPQDAQNPSPVVAVVAREHDEAARFTTLSSVARRLLIMLERHEAAVLALVSELWRSPTVASIAGECLRLFYEPHTTLAAGTRDAPAPVFWRAPTLRTGWMTNARHLPPGATPHISDMIPSLLLESSMQPQAAERLQGHHDSLAVLIDAATAQALVDASSVDLSGGFGGHDAYDALLKFCPSLLEGFNETHTRAARPDFPEFRYTHNALPDFSLGDARRAASEVWQGLLDGARQRRIPRSKQLSAISLALVFSIAVETAAEMEQEFHRRFHTEGPGASTAFWSAWRFELVTGARLLTNVMDDTQLARDVRARLNPALAPGTTPLDARGDGPPVRTNSAAGDAAVPALHEEASAAVLPHGARSQYMCPICSRSNHPLVACATLQGALRRGGGAVQAAQAFELQRRWLAAGMPHFKPPTGKPGTQYRGVDNTYVDRGAFVEEVLRRALTASSATRPAPPTKQVVTFQDSDP